MLAVPPTPSLIRDAAAAPEIEVASLIRIVAPVRLDVSPLKNVLLSVPPEGSTVEFRTEEPAPEIMDSLFANWDSLAGAL